MDLNQHVNLESWSESGIKDLESCLTGVRGQLKEILGILGDIWSEIDAGCDQGRNEEKKINLSFIQSHNWLRASEIGLDLTFAAQGKVPCECLLEENLI